MPKPPATRSIRPPPQSSDDDVTADQLYHGTPLHFTITRGDGYVNIEWTRDYSVNNRAVSDWVIYMKDDQGFFPIDTIQIYKNPVAAYNENREPGARQDYTVDNLTNGVQYEFRIVGNYFHIKELVADTTKATPMGLPGSPNLVGDWSNGSVSLSWDAPPNNGSAINEYVISARIGKTNPFWPIKTVPGSETAYTVPNLTNGMPYEFFVTARNGVGVGPLSNLITLTPAGPPGVPQNFTATREGDGIRLSWDTPDDGGRPIIHYSLLAYLDRFNHHWIGQVEATQTTYLVTGLPDYNTVEFRLYATTDYSAGSYASVTLTAPG